ICSQTKAGEPTAGPRAPSFLVQFGFLPGPGRPPAGAWTVFLQGLNSLPPWRGRPSFGAWRAFLQSQSGLPPVPGQAASVARTAFLQLQDRQPPWPERPSSSSRTGYLRGQGSLPVNGYLHLISNEIANLVGCPQIHHM
ncbi:MAG: hypothetical protein LBT40_18100, partial [Deltaproteobacteria bacterium]|nr:hypothetical protein [Deltaproteobacteria bacterium]